MTSSDKDSTRIDEIANGIFRISTPVPPVRSLRQLAARLGA